MTKVTDIISRDFYGSATFHLHREWEVQRPPYKAALPFRFSVGSRLAASSSAGPYSPNEGQWSIGRQDLTHARNLCYSKLVDQLGDTATWANNLLEAHGSLGMIEGRAMQLFRFANSLRKGDFGKAAKALSLGTTPKGYPKKGKSPKDFGNAFLEWHFGWVPMVEDIGAAVDTLQDTDFGGKTLHASATLPYGYHVFNRGDDQGSYEMVNEQGSISVRMGAHARVSNPNAYLANQMGFVNPLSVAWEAVPFSFVADWFTNVGQVVSSLSDFVGVELSNAYTTGFQAGSKNYTSFTKGHPQGWWPDDLRSYASKGCFCDRTASITGPSLEVKPFKGFSPTRAATAISLLLQAL